MRYYLLMFTTHFGIKYDEAQKLLNKNLVEINQQTGLVFIHEYAWPGSPTYEYTKSILSQKELFKKISQFLLPQINVRVKRVSAKHDVSRSMDGSETIKQFFDSRNL